MRQINSHLFTRASLDEIYLLFIKKKGIFSLSLNIYIYIYIIIIIIACYPTLVLYLRSYLNLYQNTKSCMFISQRKYKIKTIQNE